MIEVNHILIDSEAHVMQEMKQQENTKTKSANRQQIDRNKVPSPILARLIEEVRNKEISSPNVYNRFHNRHNR
jgi:hypothetical protein